MSSIEEMESGRSEVSTLIRLKASSSKGKAQSVILPTLIILELEICHSHLQQVTSAPQVKSLAIPQVSAPSYKLIIKHSDMHSTRRMLIGLHGLFRLYHAVPRWLTKAMVPSYILRLRKRDILIDKVLH